MATRRVVLVLAACTAALGAATIATGSRWIASSCGLLAIATAVLVVLERPSAPEPDDDQTDRLDEPTPTNVAFRSAGMLDEAMLGPTLRGRIAVARRALRPLSLIHVEVAAGELPGAGDEFVVSVLGGTLRESDACGRRADGVYVLILEETGEDGAVWTAERLRRKLAATAGDRRFSAGVASYPSHGLEAEVLHAKADAALAAAREWHRDRIEVAAGS